MKYLYSEEMCRNCIRLKEKFDSQGVEYIERSAGRLKVPEENYDAIDEEAFAQLSMQNMELPVVVNKQGGTVRVELNDYTMEMIIRPDTDFERQWLDNNYGDLSFSFGNADRPVFIAKIINHGSIKETKGLLIKKLDKNKK